MTIRSLVSVIEPKEREKFSPLFETLGQVVNKEIIDGILLEDLSLVSGITNPIPHRLGRNPRGWLLVAKNANADVWEGERDKSFISFECDNDVIISLWVF